MRAWMPPVLALAAIACGDAGAPTDSAHLRFVAVSAGAAHSCGRTNVGTTYCWGGNALGEIGAKTDEAANTAPLQVLVRPLGLTSISAGAVSSCGVLNTLVPLCWGNGESSPRTPQGGGHFSIIAAGEFVCGIRDDAVTICWDDQDAEPYPIQGPVFTQLSVGGLACGLAADGAAWCWQKGSSVAEMTPEGFTFTAITAGGGHACGIQPDGIAFCWGQNDRGQLGDRTTISRATPDTVAGIQLWTQLAAGRSHTCGIATDGIAYCWGEGASGQLGLDGPPPAGGFVSSPIRVRSTALPAGVQWNTVSAGYEHSCGSTVDGLAFCWGNNTMGQLGDGTTLASPGPVPIGSNE